MPSPEGQDNDPTLSIRSPLEEQKCRINLKTDKPSNTLLVSELTKAVTETELLALFGTYGAVSQIFLSKNGVILLEFANVSTASDLVYNSKVSSFKVGSHVVRLSFSSQSIDEYKSLSSPNVSRSSITKVLHFLVTNLVYTINVDVLHKICSPLGKITRIYMGKKNLKDNSIEALIEFSTETDAKSVKDGLDGNDIYSSCCSLTISYSKMHRIFVERNDTESYDYSIVPKAGLLGPPPSSVVYPVENSLPSYMPVPFGIPPLFSPPIYPPPYQTYNSYQPSQDRKQSSSNYQFYKSDATIQETVEGVVLQCRNFSAKVKADNIFNLFCLYGNVEKVKLATENPSIAYIQMSNREGADFCLVMLAGVRFFNKTLDVSMSKLTQLTDSSPNCDPVHSYFSDVNNRFKTTFQGKSRIFCPSQTLHFFNVPSNFRAEEIADVFVSAKVKDPSQVVIFPRRSGGNLRGSLVTGLIEFDTVEQAIEGVLMVNHTRLLLPQVSHPFHIKLAFSPTRISEQHIKSSFTTDGAQNELDRPTKRALEGDDNGIGCGDSKSARM